MRVGAIIAAAGEGKRFNSTGGETKKQFAELGGEPLVLRSVRIFSESPIVDEILAVVSESDLEKCDRLLESTRGVGRVTIIEGGAHRQESVYNGFSHIRDRVEVVVIHDAARPFLNRDWIAETVELASSYDGAVVAVPATDTLKACKDGLINETVDRTTIWQAQTPQTFTVEVLGAAFDDARTHGITGTDEAQLVEAVGGQIAIVEGSRFNLKVTNSSDMALAEAVLAAGVHG